MKSHNSAATDKALALVAAGMSQVQAARACGLAISTVWRAVRRAGSAAKIGADTLKAEVQADGSIVIRDTHTQQGFNPSTGKPVFN